MRLTLLSGVAVDGREVTGPRVRALLALLATDLRGGLSAGALVDGLWTEAVPEHPGKALQVLVSRSRAQLGAELIAGTATGYRLALDPGEVDATAFDACADAAERHARAGDAVAALGQAEAGLSLWDGGIGASGAEDPVTALRAARVPIRHRLLTVRALSLSRTGRHAEAVGPLAEAAAREPRREEILAELLRAEAATAGPAAALARYDGYRRTLRDELGADPGEMLRAAHRQLLHANEPVVRAGLRHDPNPLVGRDGEVRAVTGLLHRSRVVSVVGPGGLGKTRLAHAVGYAARQRAVFLVELASVARDDAVAATVAAALGAGEVAGGHSVAGPVAGIARKLGSGAALLILDNCEQVLPGVADLVGALVSLTRELRVLVTSRAPLGLSSEVVHQLPALEPVLAAELFTQRARAVRPDVELPSEHVHALCVELDGLPLALELAAARVRVMSVAEMRDRLADRFTLLRGGSRDAPQRHRTLHAVVEWSWQLLDEPGRAAMRLLSVFPDGFTAAAGNRVLDGDLVDTLDLLTYLADQSLIQVTGTAAGTRFRMLRTVREFAAARRADVGEEQRALRGFLAWATEFGLERTPYALTELAETTVVAPDQDNLVRALGHALAEDNGAAVAAIWSVLGSHWFVGAHYARVGEFAPACARVLSHLRPEPALVAATRTAAVVCAMNRAVQGGFDARALLVLRGLPAAPPDTPVGALAAAFRTAPELLGGDHAVLDRLCGSDSPLLAALGRLLRSVLAEQSGDRAAALAAAELMLAALERAPGDWLRFQARCRIGRLALMSERADQAQRELAAALHQLDGLGPRPDRGDLVVGSALAALQFGDLEAAGALLAQLPDRADPFAHPYALVAHAEIRLARGDQEDGLWRWRDIVKLVSGTENPFYRPDPRGVQVWALEVCAAAVMAHAQGDRLDLVADLIAELTGQALALLAAPSGHQEGHLAESTACGAVLLALAAVDLARGQAVSGAELTALAEAFGPPHQIHPTMASARARAAAENADEAAYLESRSSYAALDFAGLRAATLSVLERRRALATGLAGQ
ncbi:ATP-binding protein [Nocardia sp. NBC_00511]|uniref:ATP-binding protein n=1 Tax=Nocardia sp. NBC_00511 TaxID=2903591 RepID=UPI0030E5E5DC